MSPEPFVSRAKALPAKRNEKGYGDENGFYIDILGNFSYFQWTRMLVKFRHQMKNSVARSNPFQGNKKYNDYVQFHNLKLVAKGDIAPQ